MKDEVEIELGSCCYRALEVLVLKCCRGAGSHVHSFALHEAARRQTLACPSSHGFARLGMHWHSGLARLLTFPEVRSRIYSLNQYVKTSDISQTRRVIIERCASDY